MIASYLMNSDGISTDLPICLSFFLHRKMSKRNILPQRNQTHASETNVPFQLVSMLSERNTAADLVVIATAVWNAGPQL